MSTQFKNTRAWATIGIFASALFLGACSTTSTTRPEELLAKIQNAKTPADHEELARIYERDAQEALDLSGQHKKMGQLYATTPPGKGPGFVMKNHCEDLAAKYAEIGVDKKALAQLHRDMASQAK